VGSSHRCLKTKRLLKKQFNARHIDQVFDDFSKKPQEVHNGTTGPVGTSSRRVVALRGAVRAQGRRSAAAGPVAPVRGPGRP